VGNRIRKYRKDRGWTQDVFGDLSGLNRAHVGEVERGESNVTIQTLKIIADTLKVKIEDLVRGI
jgi:transcriptional regulator with XRE-family HTH domain